MDQPSVQQVFFQHIKNNLPPHLSLVDEIAELLNISNDSAYRRIRGEKGVSFDELRTLCMHFKISLDQLLYLNSDSIIFSGSNVDSNNHTFDLWLQNVLGLLQYGNSFERREFFFILKDMPFFYNFYQPELAAFKFFFWMKTILQYPLFGKPVFATNEVTENLQKTSAIIAAEYNKMPTQEIWNAESIHTSIRQIEYYKDTKMFSSAADVVHLYECLEKMIDHIEKQAELGYKFLMTGPGSPSVPKIPYKLFVNEFILGDNTVLAILNDTKVVYLNHTVLNIMWTKDTRFAEYTYQHVQNIIRKSTLISEVGEKERSRFFNTIREKLHKRKKAAENYIAD
ncbi:MAG TPA: hypothetical protein VMI12_11915 [Puia sp.]|nr:hypothetical protein [Puia sp.]